MNVKSWLQTAKKQINSLDAELILLHALEQKDRTYLALHENTSLSENQLSMANALLQRRETGEPLAYLLGYKEFYGRDFLVNKHTLIPRPESESIIRLALALNPRNTLDIGTGSGCLAITLAAELSEPSQKNAQNPTTPRVTATDISEQALSIARQNAARLTAKNPPTFILSDLLENIPRPEIFDLIIANLPYVDPTWDWLDLKTLRHEPSQALYAKDQGLSLIKKLLHQLHDTYASENLRQESQKPRHLILEADPCQHQAIIASAGSLGFTHQKTEGFALLFQA